MQITRRYFLKSSGVLAAYCGIAPLRALAGAAGLTDPAKVRRNKTLVTLFLRGGMDGLNLVVPYGDLDYYKIRQRIAIPRPGQDRGALDLDGFFGLHPSAKALLPLFRSGQAVALQAVGYDKNTRSHFEEQDTWETGVIGNTVSSDGWLNRHLISSEGHGPIRAISIGDNLPRILRGKAAAYAIRGISDLSMPKTVAGEDTVMAALEHAYCTEPHADFTAARDLLAQTADSTLDGIRQLKKIAAENYQPGAKYPKGRLGDQLREAARLIKANVGLEVVEVDYDGWDTHNNQGGVDGNYARLVQTLAESVAAFCQDLGDRLNDVLVLTLSDFGRTASENGTGGTDHGWANCMLAAGGGVGRAGGDQARAVLGRWPGLAPEQLHQKRDLLHTTDFRDVIGEVVKRHLGNANIEKVLPKHQFEKVGLI